MPKSEQCLKTAKKAYDDNRLLGSDDKDICNAREAKVIGGYVNCGGSLLVKKELRLWQPLFRRGLACQLAPLKLSSWPSPLTSSTCLSLEDGLRYCCFGAPSWASCQAFNFVDLSAYSPHAWRVVALPRRVATELCLLAVMAPISSPSTCRLTTSRRSWQRNASNQRGQLRRLLSADRPITLPHQT